MHFIIFDLYGVYFRLLYLLLIVTTIFDYMFSKRLVFFFFKCYNSLHIYYQTNNVKDINVFNV